MNYNKRFYYTYAVHPIGECSEQLVPIKLKPTPIKNFIRQELLSLLSDIKKEMPKEVVDERLLADEPERNILKTLGQSDREIDHDLLHQKIGHNLCLSEITSILNQKEQELK